MGEQAIVRARSLASLRGPGKVHTHDGITADVLDRKKRKENEELYTRMVEEGKPIFEPRKVKARTSSRGTGGM
jgi:hypothetical protein